VVDFKQRKRPCAKNGIRVLKTKTDELGALIFQVRELFSQTSPRVENYRRLEKKKPHEKGGEEKKSFSYYGWDFGAERGKPVVAQKEKSRKRIRPKRGEKRATSRRTVSTKCQKKQGEDDTLVLI